MRGSCVTHCTCNKSDYCYALSLFNSEPRHIFRERRSGFNSRGAIKSASIQFRRTSPCHPIEVHTVKHLPSFSTPQSQFDGVAVPGQKQIQRKLCEGAKLNTGGILFRRLSSTPSWERATRLSTTQQTQSSIPTTKILLVRMMFLWS